MTLRLAMVPTVLLVALLGLAACDSGGDGDSTSAGTPPADEAGTEEPSGGDLPASGCDIVTVSDAEQVLGGAVTTDDDMTEGAGPAPVGCFYERDLGGIDFSLLSFEVYEGEEFYGEEIFAADAETLDQLDLGDRAFVAVSVTGLTVQFILDGNTVILNVSGNGIEPADFRDELLDVAGRVETALSEL